MCLGCIHRKTKLLNKITLEKYISKKITIDIEHAVLVYKFDLV